MISFLGILLMFCGLSIMVLFIFWTLDDTKIFLLSYIPIILFIGFLTVSYKNNLYEKQLLEKEAIKRGYASSENITTKIEYKFKWNNQTDGE